MKQGTWTKEGHAPLHGQWEYYWPSDRFIVLLDVASARRIRKSARFVLAGEKPEWSGWKLHREAA